MNSETTAYIPREEDCIQKIDMQCSISRAIYKIQAQIYYNATDGHFIAYQVQGISKDQPVDEPSLEFFDEGFRQISESEAGYYMNKYFDTAVLSRRLCNEIDELKNPRLHKLRTKNSTYHISHRKPSRKRKYIVSHIAGAGI